MASNQYHFVTRWRVRGTCEEAADVISDADGLPRWWPAVYLRVDELEPGEESGIGRVIDLHTKGWLPYTLRWRFTVTESDYPHNLALRAEGDFVGEGRWTFTQDGEWVDVVYDWRVAATKPLLRRLSWLMKPIFAANHRWAMARGLESLELELARRRMLTENERASVPRPPGATSLKVLAVPMALGVITSLAFIAATSRRRKK
jgi:hypothetical protein